MRAFGILAAFFWIVGVGARLAFAFYAENGGGESVYRFTVANHLTTSVWAPALNLMALLEVLGRSGGLGRRGYGRKLLHRGGTTDASG
ncbi:MAG: hypothetical protein WBZ07_01595 [Candidatus Dormiibacterota bacterium]